MLAVNMMGHDMARDKRDHRLSTADTDARQLDERLDEALKETFPASDPVAVTPRRRSPPPKRRKETG